MSSIMLIDFTGSTATRTNEIGQAMDGGDLRTTVRAKLEFVAKESHIVHRVPAIRADVTNAVTCTIKGAGRLVYQVGETVEKCPANSAFDGLGNP